MNILELKPNDVVYGTFFKRLFAARVIANLPYHLGLRELHLRASQALAVAGGSETDFTMWVDAQGQMLSLDGKRVVAVITGIEDAGGVFVEEFGYGVPIYVITPPCLPEGRPSISGPAAAGILAGILVFLYVAGITAMILLHGARWISSPS